MKNMVEIPSEYIERLLRDEYTDDTQSIDKRAKYYVQRALGHVAERIEVDYGVELSIGRLDERSRDLSSNPSETTSQEP